MSTPTTVTVAAGDQAALAGAARGDAEWLWLLAPAARPGADALERLLQAARPRGEPAAAIVAGLVLDDRGEVIDRALPGFRQSDEEAVVRLVARRLLPIRSAPFDHCLVARECFERYGLPDRPAFGRFAAVVWSARVLSAEAGYFTPLSRVTVPPDSLMIGGGRGAAARGAVRAARSGAWTRGETLRALAGLVAGG